MYPLLNYMRFLIILIIIITKVSGYATAQVINLDSNLSFSNLGKQITYYEDKKANLTLDEIKALSENGKFKKGETDILNLRNTKSAFWIRIDYRGKATEKNYLMLDVPNIEYIDLYIDSDHGLIHRSAGALLPPPQGVTISNNYIFNLPIQQNNNVKTTVWLRLKTNNILIVPIKLVTSENLIERKFVKNSFEVIYIGILLTLFIFNIFLYFSIKDRTYFYYSLYVFFLGTYVVTYLRGYSYLLGSDFRIMLNQYPHIFLSLSIVASIFFSRKLLNLKSLPQIWIKVYNTLMIAALVLFLTSALGFKSVSSNLAQIISLISTIVLWSVGLVAYRHGHKQAKYYILAWSFIAFTILALVLSLANVLPFYDFTFEFVPLGSTIELLLLAFALGDRYRIIMTNEQKMRDENLKLIQTQNQSLENLVEERTIKLTDTILQLESSNAVKNKLFSIIAHDLRSPFNSLMSIFSLKDMDLLSLEELKMLLNENKKNIDTIHNTLNNLLYWAVNQMDGIKTQPSKFNLKALIEDLNLVYAPLIQSKGISINLQISNQHIVYADENQIQLVLRNLIDNAIKFTPPSYSIDISAITKQNQLKITVSNSVLGENEINLDSLTSQNAFEVPSGTSHEKGIGLGLHLCREYIKSNGSELEVKIDSTQISFGFELPLVVQTGTICA
jgi:signal transduction histidine kinase